ncbi:MAG TPA: DnaJ family domain-containing protein [Caldilineaceae bacterium]|nr:DnaJ family domain-containing protein [Caldilineaceae bacterium]
MSQGQRNPSRLLFFRPPAKRQGPKLAAAREKAAEYQQREPIPAEPISDEEEPKTTLEQWADIVTQRIEEAMRRGEFDNLPGRGKPMQVMREPFVPEDQQMAFKLLKNNDMTPDWIAERKELLKVKERFSQQVQSIAQEALAQWAAAGDEARRENVQAVWARWLARWESEVAEINRRIQTLNLKQPIAHLEVFKIRLDDELRRAGVARTLKG